MPMSSTRAVQRLKKQINDVEDSIGATLDTLRTKAKQGEQLTESERWVYENARLLKTSLREVREAVQDFRRMPELEAGEPPTLRAHAAAAGFLSAESFVFDEAAFTANFGAAQERVPWPLHELGTLKPLMQFVLLERIAAGKEAPGTLITALKRTSEARWLELVEQISQTEHVLRDDPAGAYAAMDAESRNLYRRAIELLAKRSKLSEEAIGREAISLARQAQTSPEPDKRMAERRAHVGFYLVDRGKEVLERKIGYRPTLGEILRRLLLRYPTPAYLLSLELATVAVIVFVLAGIGVTRPIWAAVLILLLPASEAAIAMINRLTTWLLRPRVLPKLDFKNGIPPQYTTMTVVPTLLLDEEQVRETVQQFEIRYLANRQPNLFFALLTDTPDSLQRFDERDKLVELCAELVNGLNRKYGGVGPDPFFLFHRHRVYNEAEGIWLGWERKRGKLLDLNNLLRGVADNFPVKICDNSVLPKVRYVITLDADTQLPKDTAHRLVGTLAHPLNRAVIGPATNTVVEGYGILQPRIGVSVHSASRSRLAAIFSGETGFDIYTRAVSEVYQDLFGEGSFTGKGIYEVDTFQTVLAQRFPENALLSHDLIEGAHARAGLVSDIELIDDYPTRFSAYSRRKHRWVRGDWQIMLWLLPRVPDYLRRFVPNPISTLSRWKILDNLRRSLLDVSMFALLLAGWFFLPGGAMSWTIATLVLLVLPSYFELLLAAIDIPCAKNRRAAFQGTLEGFLTRQVNVLFTLAFLSHQALVMLDAVCRTVVRMAVTKRKLLEWETAAQAEAASGKRTPVERYLDWTPGVSAGILLAMIAFKPYAIPSALPILILWAGLKPLVRWLDRPLPMKKAELSDDGVSFLRGISLRTWRYFRHFGGPAENWLIPDNVQETPERVAHRTSPTNLGVLLNSRLAAYELGYVTLTELVSETEATFGTMRRLERMRGHFLNWYNTQTLQPLHPLFISTVDSGNLAASLWTMKQPFLEFKARPPLENLWRGVQDHAQLVREVAGRENVPGSISSIIQQICRDAALLKAGPGKWWEGLARMREQAVEVEHQLAVNGARASEVHYWVKELANQVERLQEAALLLTAWALPETRAALRRLGVDAGPADGTEIPLEGIPAFAESLCGRVMQAASDHADAAAPDLIRSFKKCGASAADLLGSLQRLAADSETFVSEMDFRFLYNSERKLLSVGYDVEAGKLHRSWYDLLASEARTAQFIAIAKGDIPQESWFHLGRGHVLWRGERVLMSWTGTMFEYLMPFLWMRPYSDTILERSASAAVRVQREFAASHDKNIPWGISEAACAERNSEGDYLYYPFGVPPLALKPRGADEPDVGIVAPYATFLALAVDLEAALPNLRAMEARDWIGRFGYFEAAQVATDGCEVVRSWMVHHQGMILLAICNAVKSGQIQKYFHAEPSVLAVELLLHEKAPAAMEAEPAQA
jgi:hypothetical protein